MVGEPGGVALIATCLPLRLELRSIGQPFSLPPLPIRLKPYSVGLPLRLPPRLPCLPGLAIRLLPLLRRVRPLGRRERRPSRRLIGPWLGCGEHHCVERER